MVSKSVKINYKGHALRIVVGLLMLALFFAYNASALTLPVNASGGAENMPVQTAASGDVNITKIGHFGGSIVLNGTVTGKVIDYESGIPLVNVSGQSATGLMTWTASNFPAFWHEDGISGETLSVNQDDLSESQRVINRDNLVYSSTKRVVPYKIYTETGLAVWNGLDSNGSRVISGGYYAKVGWLGKPYVAANGQAFKLSEIILEQNSTDLKNLNVNETWNLGEDHNLTLIALDKNARHAFFNLSNKSGIISEFIVEEGNSNTVWRNLADESDAPFFVTYIDNLSENSVRLKYT
ncbi:MAG TPA: S-layer protein domain-containing protein [Candidatus Methanoperedens sp.]